MSPSPSESRPPPKPRKGRKRPSGTQTRRRTHQAIGVYDEPEWVRFQVQLERYRGSAAADQYGDSVAAFMRWQTIGPGARKLPPRRTHPDLPPDVVAQIGSLMTELMRQGNNLNQIAKQLNAGGEISADVVYAALSEHRETLRGLRCLVGIED